jgi:hypothetical protein
LQLAIVRALGSKCGSRKNSAKPTECIFFISLQTRIAPRKIGFGYDEWMSGQTIYAYVGGDPVSQVDPDGLLVMSTVGGVQRGTTLSQAATLGAAGNAAMATGLTTIGVAVAVRTGSVAIPAVTAAARQVGKDLNLDGPRLGRRPGTGMICQVRYKDDPIFRIEVHPIGAQDRTPVPHFHVAPNMEVHRQLPDFMSDGLRRLLGGN